MEFGEDFNATVDVRDCCCVVAAESLEYEDLFSEGAMKGLTSK